MLDELCGGAKDRASIQNAALELARQTLEAEHAHLISQTEAFVQRTVESYNTQLAERMDLLDIFLDNLSDQEPMNARELSAELQNQVQIKNQPDRRNGHCSSEGSREARKAVSAEIENQIDRPVPFAHADDHGAQDQQPPEPGYECPGRRGLDNH